MKKQSGFTLIELMIGMLVGLIVLSAVLYAFLSTLRSSSDLLNGARLNREVSALSDIIVGEMRRVGYWPITGEGDSPFGTSPDLKLIGSNCVLYSYFNDSNPTALGAQIFRGIASEDGVFYIGELASDALSSTSCDPSADGWAELADSNIVSGALKLSLNCIDVKSPSTAVASCETATDKTYSRSMQIGIDAEIIIDPSWSSEVTETVKLQNDLSD